MDKKFEIEKFTLNTYFSFIIAFAWILTVSPVYTLDTAHCDATEVTTSSKYWENFYGDATWLRIKSMPTDGDLQTGTFITLTGPPNLSACLQQLQSEPSNAFRLNVGYNIPTTNNNVDLSYFRYKGNDSDQIKNIKINQLFQSFLGGAYSTKDSCEDQELHLAHILVGKQFINDCNLTFRPYVGLAYANITRNMDVTFTGLIDSPPTVPAQT